MLELGGGLWILEQGLAELAAEGLPPVEQSVPLDMPQTFCIELLTFFPAMPEAHPGCTVFVSIISLNNSYLNNNQKPLCIYIYINFGITATVSSFGASASQNAGY